MHEPTEEQLALWDRQARHFATKVHFNRSIGVKITQWRPEGVVMELAHAEWLCNSGTGMHGGVISSLADTCGTAASLAACGADGFISTVTMTINYLAAATTDLVATGICVKPGRRIQVSDVKVHDTGGKLIATAVVTSTLPQG